MQERCEKLQMNIQDLEGKGQSLQTTIDRLSMALAKSEEEEHQQKDKVCTCSPYQYILLYLYVSISLIKQDVIKDIICMHYLHQ